MKQLKQLLLVMAIALTGFPPAQAQTQWTHYSEWMANTQKSYVYSDDDYWRYDDGLMYESILDTYEHYKNGGGDFTDATLKNAVKTYIDACVNSTGSITNYKSGDLDDIRPARMVYKYYKLYGGDNLKTACKTVMACNAFKDNARVISQSTGYPWQHKADYTEQVWLDGIFMGLPYWTLAGPDAEIGSSLHSSWSANDFFNDAVSQMQKTDEKTYEPTIGLWCHAWDATEPFSLFWSTKNKNFTDNTYSEKHSPYELIPHDGRSSHCWGRALGWYAMAIMETMDNIAAVNGAADSRITTLKALFKKVMDKVVETRDPSEGVWHCVIDVDATQAPYKDYSTKNNYLEATCSAMFTYCLLHGVAQGYLDSSYLPVAKDAYNKFITKFIDGTGTNLTMSNCMSVGGLGPGENYKSPNYKRDGSYAYYMSESIVNNDSKGVGPFIWASLEAEKTYGYTITGGFSTPVASDDIVQFRWSRVADDFTVPNTTPASYVSPTFTAKTSGGTTLTNSTDITFVSDNTKVATVDDNGTITLAGEAGTANIKATMKSGAGAYVGEAIYTVTTTGTDTTKPTLSSSTPATGATDVAVSGNIVLTFSEAVTIADASKITLTGGAGTLDKEHATTDGTTITIPYSGLANSTTYTLSVDADAVKDLADNTNDALSDITFTTIAADETAPTLSSSTPTNGAPNIATNGNIVLTFSEAVTCTTNATLTPAGGSAVNLTPTVSGSTVTYSYSGLSNSTSYTFNLPANSVADLAGNNYASAINIEFTTKEAVSGNTLVVTNTSATSETFTDGSILYSIDSDGRENSTSKFGSNDIVSEGLKVKGASLSDKRFVVKFPEDVSSVTIYGYNSSSGRTLNTISTSSTMTKDSYTDITSSTTKTTSTSTPNYNYVFTTSWNTPIAANTYIWYEFNNSCNFYKIEYTTPSTPTPTTFTLTNTVNTEGYGTVSPTTVANIPSGTTTSSSSNTYTVNGKTVTATATAATAEYTYAFSGWSGLPATVSANATVTANFTRTAKEYTLAWNSNGGSELTGTYTNGSTAFGTTITAPNNPTRDGYTFNGWNSAQDGSGTPLGSTMPAAITTYYAQWTENTPVVEQVATPSITGTTPFTDNTTVTITCATSDANIYYTTNGDTPTSSSTHYTAPFSIDATTTIKAIAIKSGMTDSEIASATFTKSGGGEETPVTITIGTSTSTSYAATFTSSSTNEHITASATAFTIGSSTTSSNSSYSSATAPYSIKYKPSDNIYTSEYSDAYSVSAQFTVANGYTFTPTAISTTIVTEAANYTYQAVLTDGTTTYTSNDISSSSNEVLTFSFPSLSGTALSGTVTYKIRFKSTANNKKFFVVNLPITISGTVSSSSTPPTPTYTVTATSNNKSWGTVSVDKATAAEGATVTITTTPASGYELTSLTATDGESNPVTITNNQFPMPASNVTVNAEFAAIPPVLGTVTFSPAGGNYSSEQNVTISATNAEEIWYSTVSQAAAVKNGANATQYTSAIHIGEGSTTLYATAYLGESTTTGSATYTVTIPDVGTGTELYTFSMSGSSINFANGDSDNFSITNNKSCQIESPNKIKFRWHASNNEYGQFTLTSKNNIPIQSVRLVATIEGDDKSSWGETETVHQNVAVTNGTYDPETMTWTANSDNVTSVTFTNNYDATYNGNIYISKIIVVYYASETITIAEAGFSTLYKTYAVSVGEGGTAYYVSDIQNKNVVLTPFTNNIIPANTGAVVKGTFGDEVELTRAIADDFTATNYLLGTDTKQNITADKDTYYYFISGRQKQPDNSYKYGWLVPNTLKTTSVFSNNANKAYLQIPKSMLDSETAARMLTLVWEDYEQPIATGIDGFATDKGFIVIDDNTPLYNLSGQRVSKDYKGIVIVNGKKVLRK